MARVLRVKNNSGASDTWVGQTIANGVYYDLEEIEFVKWRDSNKVFTDVGNGNLIVNKGADTTDDISNVVEGWNWLSGNLGNYSSDGTQLTNVSQSSKYRIIEFPINVSLPKGTTKVQTIQCLANTSSSLNDKYFLFDNPGSGYMYYIWYNANSAGTDPEIINRTGIEVTLTTDDTSSEVATATSTSMDAAIQISTTVSTDTVTATCDTSGPANNIIDGTVATGFTFNIITEGGGFTNIYTYQGSGELWSCWFDLSATNIDIEIIIDGLKVVPQFNVNRVTGFGASGQATMLPLVLLGTSNFAFTPKQKIKFGTKLEINFKTNDIATGNKILTDGYVELVKES